jgi:hypothetical protein
MGNCSVSLACFYTLLLPVQGQNGDTHSYILVFVKLSIDGRLPDPEQFGWLATRPGY